MAVDKSESSNTHKNTGGQATSATQIGMAQKRRWLVFGSNVVVAVLLATVLAGAAVWLSGMLLRGKARSDWTSTGQYSLSPRGKAVVRDLQADVTITMVATHPSENLYRSEEAYRRDLTQYERMKTLLHEYEIASSHIKFETLAPSDTASADAFLQRLEGRFKEQLVGKEAFLKEFAGFRTQVDTLVGQEVGRLQSFGTLQPPPPEVLLQNLEVAANGLIKVSKTAQLKMLSQMVGQEIPEEKAAPTIEEARDSVNAVSELFKQFPEFYKRVIAGLEKGEKPVTIPPAIKAFMESAPQRFDPIQKKAEELKVKMAALPQQKFDEVKESITGRKASLVFETEGDVKVVPVEDAWITPPMQEDQQDEPKSVFVGERVISNQLQALVRKTKPAVFFVTFGAPVAGWGGPYAALAERLRQSNFIVQEWDLMRQHEMPKVEEWEKDPPKGKPTMVIVLLPPPPPNMQRPMPPPTPEAYQPVLELVNAGTPVLVCVDAVERMMVPYEGVFAKFGLEPRFEAVAVQNLLIDPSKGTERAVPWLTQLQTTGQHPIARAMGGLSVAFIASVPVMISPKPPEGVDVTPLVLLPVSPDYWADTNMMEAMNGQAKRDEAKDIIPTKEHPVPLAVAVTRKVGDAEQRAVVFGNSLFARDRVGQYPRDLAFPGNTELFVNSVLWAGGMDNLLAVSPEVLQAQRLGDLGAWALPLRVILVGGLPALVAFVGLIVFLIRRR